MKKIAVSIHAIEDFTSDIIKNLSGIDYIHVDVADGKFTHVKHLNLDVFKILKGKYDIPIIAHMMVENPLDLIDDMHNSEDFTISTGNVDLKDTVVKAISADSNAATPEGHSFTIAGGNRISTTGDSTSTITINSDTATATKTSAYPMTANDDFIIGDTSGGGFQITLPAANAKDMVRIAKKSNSNTLTIARAGSDTIEGNTSISMTAEYSTVVLVSDGVSTWYEM